MSFNSSAWVNFHIVGDYGKLGHGNCTTQKQPRLVAGALSGKVVKFVHAGYRHSAAVTEEGELYTWGEGDHGRLGSINILKSVDNRHYVDKLMIMISSY
jgi:alpha-tubulin suppressor-like RCC1 family protein